MTKTNIDKPSALTRPNKLIQMLIVLSRSWKLISAIILILLITSIILVDYLFDRHCQSRCFSDITQVPERKVGLLLGTAKYRVGGTINPYYWNRIEAAAKLFHQKKVSFLLLSGDNGQSNYDEVTQMRKDLIALDVPAERLYRDYAGFRTLDSIVRAQKVFNENNFIVISQAFHNARALYIADIYDMTNTIAFNADDISIKDGGLKTKVREKFARILALIDTHFLQREPRFLGTPVRIGIDPPT